MQLLGIYFIVLGLCTLIYFLSFGVIDYPGWIPGMFLGVLTLCTAVFLLFRQSYAILIELFLSAMLTGFISFHFGTILRYHELPDLMDSLLMDTLMLFLTLFGVFLCLFYESEAYSSEN